MKEPNRIFRPRILLVAMALAAAGSLGAQTTGTTAAPSSPPTSATTPSACAELQGTALTDCIKLNSSAGSNASATTSSDNTTATGNATMGSGNTPMGSGNTPTGSSYGSASNTGTDTSTQKDASTMSPQNYAASGNKSASKSASAAKHAGAASNDRTNVASGTGRSTSRTQNRAAMSANPRDNAYRAELRNCVQQTGDQRERCLDQAIANHDRTQSG